MLNKKTEHPPLEMGKCPKCGASESEGFDYSGHVEYEDDYYTTDFSCSRCGCEGREIGIVVFTGYVVTEGDDEDIYEVTDDQLLEEQPWKSFLERIERAYLELRAMQFPN